MLPPPLPTNRARLIINRHALHTIPRRPSFTTDTSILCYTTIGNTPGHRRKPSTGCRCCCLIRSKLWSVQRGSKWIGQWGANWSGVGDGKNGIPRQCPSVLITHYRRQHCGRMRRHTNSTRPNRDSIALRSGSFRVSLSFLHFVFHLLQCRSLVTSSWDLPTEQPSTFLKFPHLPSTIGISGRRCQLGERWPSLCRALKHLNGHFRRSCHFFLSAHSASLSDTCIFVLTPFSISL